MLFFKLTLIKLTHSIHLMPIALVVYTRRMGGKVEIVIDVRA